MPRPRRDSEILPAKERLENAFWELLAERNYHKITVTDIVRVADVNRNSFYYHFSGLPELADSAILHAVENTPIPAVRVRTSILTMNGASTSPHCCAIPTNVSVWTVWPCSPARTVRRNSSNRYVISDA